MKFNELLDGIIRSSNRLKFYQAIEADIMIAKDNSVERCSRTTYQCARCQLYRNGGRIKDIFGKDWINSEV